MTAVIDRRSAEQFLKLKLLSGVKFVIKDHGVGINCEAQHLQFLSLALTDKPRDRGRTSLRHPSHNVGSCGIDEQFKFVKTGLGVILSGTGQVTPTSTIFPEMCGRSASTRAPPHTGCSQSHHHFSEHRRPGENCLGSVPVDLHDRIATRHMDGDSVGALRHKLPRERRFCRCACAGATGQSQANTTFVNLIVIAPGSGPGDTISRLM